MATPAYLCDKCISVNETIWPSNDVDAPRTVVCKEHLPVYREHWEPYGMSPKQFLDASYVIINSGSFGHDCVDENDRQDFQQWATRRAFTLGRRYHRRALFIVDTSACGSKLQAVFHKTLDTYSSRYSPEAAVSYAVNAVRERVELMAHFMLYVSDDIEVPSRMPMLNQGQRYSRNTSTVFISSASCTTGSALSLPSISSIGIANAGPL